MTKVRLGSVIHATLREEDLIPAFIEELKLLDPGRAAYYLERIPEEALDDEDHTWWQTGEAYWMLDELFDVLNEYAPPFCYFGAHEGDGSDFGFWIDRFALQEAIENGEVLKASELPNSAPEGYEYVAVVDDHGGVTLYQRSWDGKLEEVWSVV